MANHSAKMASLVTVPTHQQHSSSYINVLVFLPRPSREQQQQRLTRVRHEKDVSTENGGRKALPTTMEDSFSKRALDRSTGKLVTE